MASPEKQGVQEKSFIKNMEKLKLSMIEVQQEHDQSMNFVYFTNFS